MRKFFRVFILLQALAVFAHAQTISQAEYFLNADPGIGNGIPLAFTPGDEVTESFSLTLDGLPPGYHFLSIRARDNLGNWSIVNTHKIYVYETAPQAFASQALPLIQAEYFFGNDPGPGNATPLPLIRGDTIDIERYLPTAGMDTGQYILSVRFMDENGAWGLSQSVAVEVGAVTCTFPDVDFVYQVVTFGTPAPLTSIVQNALPGASYAWDIGNNGTVDYTTPNITHIFTHPGVYQAKLTVDNGHECQASVIKDVIAGPLPNPAITVNGSLTFCQGGSVVLSAGNDPLVHTYQWSNGKTTPSVTITESGSYYVWITNQYGNFVKSEVIDVVVHPLPQVNLVTRHASDGKANGSAYLEISGVSGNYSIIWSNGATESIVNQLLPGNYSVTVDDGFCPVVLNFIIYDEEENPGDIVEAEYFINTDPGVGNATPLYVSAGTNLEFAARIPMEGFPVGFNYLYIRVRNTEGAWSIPSRSTVYVTDTTKYELPPQPMLTAVEYFFGGDPSVGQATPLTITPGDLVDFDGMISVGEFAPGFHNIHIRAKDEEEKWSIIKSQKFHIYDSNFEYFQPNMRTIGHAEYFFNTDPGVGNGTPLDFFYYDEIDINRFFRVAGLPAGNHFLYVRVMDEDGNWSIAMRQPFTVDAVNCDCPEVAFTTNVVTVAGMPTIFTNISTGIDPGAVYEWDVNNNGVTDYTTFDITHTYPDHGIYNARLTIRNTDECFASYIGEVIVSPPVNTTLSLSGPTAFCRGGSVVITAEPGYSYDWSTGEKTQSIEVTEPGSYRVRLTNVYGVQDVSQWVNVTVYPLPSVSLMLIDANTGLANGTAIAHVEGGIGTYTYTWSTGGSFSLENNLPEGNHYLVVDDGFCPVTVNFTIGSTPINPGDIVAAEYFFSNDPGIGNGTPLNIAGGDEVFFATFLPVTGVDIGYHTLNIRTLDTEGKWSIAFSEVIYVYDGQPGVIGDQQPPMVEAEYFLNEDPGPGNGNPVALMMGDVIDYTFPIDTYGLDPGFNKLGVRVKDAGGKWSQAMFADLYVFGDVPTPFTPLAHRIIAGEYFFNDDPGPGNGIPIAVNPTTFNLDMDRMFSVEGLPVGLHRLSVRTMDEEGRWSLSKTVQFAVEAVSCTMPTVDFEANTVNQGNPTDFTNNSLDTHSGTTYEWDIYNNGTIDFTSRDISFTFPNSGLFDVRLTVRNSEACHASLIHQVFVGPMPNTGVTITGNTTFCDEDFVVLTASPGYSYRWWPTGETTQSIMATESATYYVWVTTASGIELRSDPIEVTRHQSPMFTLFTNNASGGKNNGSAWVEVSGGSGNYSYQWSNGSFNPYANNLLPGFHFLTVNDGHCPVSAGFFIANVPVVPGNIIAAEYFFNTDPGVGQGQSLNISAGNEVRYFTGVSVAGLDVGYHNLVIRTKDTYNKWSIAHAERIYVYDPAPVYVPAISPPIVAAEYFIDIDPDVNPDPGPGLGGPVAVTAPGDELITSFDYEIGSLSLGFHNVFVRVKDEYNRWSLFKSAKFHVFDTQHHDLTVVQPDIVAAEYFFNTDPGPGNGTPLLDIIPGSQVDWTGSISIAHLSLGFHWLYIRTLDESGKWSIAKSALFGVYECTQPTADFSFVPVCIDQPVVFNDLSTNVGPGAIYEWDINNDGVWDYTTTAGDLIHQYTEPGTYQVKLRITHNVACMDSVLKTVSFPFVTLGNDTTIFVNQEIILNAGPGYASYLWNDGSVFQTLTVVGSEAGIGTHTYSVTVTNDIGCSYTAQITISVVEVVNELYLADDANVFIKPGDVECFFSIARIVVAGGDYDFVVESGGEVKLVAGQSITMMPGTKVLSGGYLHAYIDDGNPCGRPFVKEEEYITNLEPETQIRAGQFFKVYPNPTTGEFTVELLNKVPFNQSVRIEVYNLMGTMVAREELPAEDQYRMSLLGQPPGMYIVRVFVDGEMGIERLIKR